MVPFVRRNRVDERRAALIAAGCALPAAVSGATPTGSAAIDVVLVVVAVGGLSWVAASSPWWSLAAIAGVGVAFGGSWPTAVGVVALVGAWWIGQRNDHLSDARVVVASLAFHSLVWSTAQVSPWAVVVSMVVIVVAVVGSLRRRPSQVRRLSTWTLVVIGGGAFVAVALFALASLGARQAIDDSRALAREALVALRAGDVDGAVGRLDAAARSAQRADDRVGGVVGQPARLVPVIAQHRAAVVTLSRESATQFGRASRALASIDLESLRLEDGRIDLAALGALAPVVTEVADAVDQLAGAVSDVESRWLVPAVRERLDAIRAEVDEQREMLAAARDLVRVAPGLLGSEGERRYLVLFTTPSEARGSGGFSGNFAEIRVVDGTLDLGDFGRTSELDDALRGSGARCEPCAEELLDGYGDFGLTTGDGGAVGEVPWKNLTMPAHFPYVAEAAQTLYRHAGRGVVDGVAVMDPYVMRRFLRYTGPVRADGIDDPVGADDILPFVLFEQYLGDSNAERIDALDSIGRSVIGALLGGSLPDPVTLAADLLPLVRERRLLLWVAEPAAREALALSGLDGGLPVVDPLTEAGFGVTVNNAGANKIDAFLDLDVDVAIEGSGSSRRLVAEVTLTNTAPADGLPRYIIGNPFGLPMGTNRYYISFYAAVLPSSITRDGRSIGLGSSSEAGWRVGSRFDWLTAGSTSTYRLEYEVPASFSTLDDLIRFSPSLVRERTDLGGRAPDAA